MERHYIHAYIGGGKGKSTAAAGLAVRAAAAGRKVVFAQLLKNGSSENAAFEKLGITLIAPPVKKFVWNMTDDERSKTAADIRAAVREAAALCEKGGLAVFDELLDAYENGMISPDLLKEVCSLPCEVVLTGRRLPSEVAPLCGYISEILPISHPFSKEGAIPRKGIEY